MENSVKMQMVPYGYVTPVPEGYFKLIMKLSDESSFNQSGEIKGKNGFVQGTNVHELILDRLNPTGKHPKGYSIFKSLLRPTKILHTGYNPNHWISKSEPVVNVLKWGTPEVELGQNFENSVPSTPEPMIIDQYARTPKRGRPRKGEEVNKRDESVQRELPSRKAKSRPRTLWSRDADFEPLEFD